MARLELPLRFFQERDRLRQVFGTLNGNGRGLTFFAAAVREMPGEEEAAFLAQLAKAEQDTQTDMALATIIEHLPPEATRLLHRLPVFQVPVPLEGIVKLGLDLAEPKALLGRLLAVSLVEQRAAPRWQTVEFSLPPLVSEWLHEQGVARPEQAHWQTAARYLDYLYRNERHSVGQAIAMYQALMAAGERETADRFALDRIVGPLNRAGLYQTLLDEWLLPICVAENSQIKAEALGQTGKQYLHLGNFQTALGYLEQSLKISQAIGDKSGEGTTLNNISQIFKARGDYETALGYLEQSLKISQAIGDKSGEGTTLNNISQIFKARGDYETALGYLEQSLKIRQAIGDKSGEGTTLNNISQIYDARGDYETALGYLEQSLKIRQAIGDKSGEGTTLNNISQIYDARGDYETALGYLEQSLKISQAIGDTAGLCVTLFNMGHIHWQNEEIQKALGAWVTAYRLARQTGWAQALQELEGLAGQLGLDGGLAGWEALSQRMAG